MKKGYTLSANEEVFWIEPRRRSFRKVVSYTYGTNWERPTDRAQITDDSGRS